MKSHITLLSEQPSIFEFDGRLGWALTELAGKGPRAVGKAKRPAPGLICLCPSLRKAGIPMETEMEPHDGTYSGSYARYRLTCDVHLEVPTPGKGPHMTFKRPPAVPNAVRGITRSLGTIASVRCCND